MTQVLSFFDNVVANTLLEKQENESKTLRPFTGKLTGTMIGMPLQEQILRMLGLPGKPFDSFTLRKFERGHHVEAWVLSVLPGLLDKKQLETLMMGNPGVTGLGEDDQIQIEYRGCTGHVDAIVDMAVWSEPELGVIPHEIKSVSNADFNHSFGPRASFRVGPKRNHKLQVGLYAMAMGAKHFMLHYIASDDYRTKSYLCDISDVSETIDTIITNVEETLKAHRIPAFVPQEDWQANKNYQTFPTWSDLSSDEATKRLAKEYPNAYERLLSF